MSTGGDPPFWFLLDLAAAREHSISLSGPPLRELIGPVPRDEVRRALRDSMAWHAVHGGHGPDTVLNACRTLHWLHHGAWLSKSAAGAWALREAGAPPIVAAALARRRAGSDADLDPAAVRAFTRTVG